VSERSDRTLAQLAQSGDRDAFEKIFARYSERLIRLARLRISERLASRIEAEDVVQSVFRTFFGRMRNRRFGFEEESDLWKLLVSMTLNKLRNKVDWHTAAKRDVRAEHSIDADRQALPSAFDADGQSPSPSAVIAFLDLLEDFMSRLRDTDRRILELRLDGYSQQEIAQEMGCTERTVRRVLERIRALAEERGVRQQLAD
jgi:RNA polymerase sigma-70 factor (ECF subfamily)